MGLIKRNGNISRLEAFSDAVFAFSATLLVVSLEVPRDFDQLITDLEGFGAFALSFFALIMIWTVHNAFFRRYGLDDRVTVVLNSILLFVVLFYVYPLKFISQGFLASIFGIGMSEYRLSINNWDDLSLLFSLYSLGFVAIFLCISLMYYNAAHLADRLELTPDELSETRFFFRNYFILVTVGLLSIVLAISGIGLRIGMPGWIYGLLGPLAWYHSHWSAKREPVLRNL